MIRANIDAFRQIRGRIPFKKGGIGDLMVRAEVPNTGLRPTTGPWKNSYRVVRAFGENVNDALLFIVRDCSSCVFSLYAI